MRNVRTCVLVWFFAEDTQDLGHQASALIVSCRYKNAFCSSEDFTLIQNWHHWNCYSFQPPAGDRSVESDKPSVGLEVRTIKTNLYEGGSKSSRNF